MQGMSLSCSSFRIVCFVCAHIDTDVLAFAYTHLSFSCRWHFFSSRWLLDISWIEITRGEALIGFCFVVSMCCFCSLRFTSYDISGFLPSNCHSFNDAHFAGIFSFSFRRFVEVVASFYLLYFLFKFSFLRLSLAAHSMGKLSLEIFFVFDFAVKLIFVLLD